MNKQEPNPIRDICYTLCHAWRDMEREQFIDDQVKEEMEWQALHGFNESKRSIYKRIRRECE